MDRTDERSILLRVEEAARLLSMSRSKVYQLIAAGALPTVRIDASVRIPRAALEAWLEAKTNGTARV